VWFFVNLAIAAGGGLLSLASYAAAASSPEGGTYGIFWGAVAFGGWFAIKNAIAWSNCNKALRYIRSPAFRAEDPAHDHARRPDQEWARAHWSDQRELPRPAPKAAPNRQHWTPPVALIVALALVGVALVVGSVIIGLADQAPQVSPAARSANTRESCSAIDRTAEAAETRENVRAQHAELDKVTDRPGHYDPGYVSVIRQVQVALASDNDRQIDEAADAFFGYCREHHPGSIR
jgi:hypothetical protein